MSLVNMLTPKESPVAWSGSWTLWGALIAALGVGLEGGASALPDDRPAKVWLTVASRGLIALGGVIGTMGLRNAIAKNGNQQ